MGETRPSLDSGQTPRLPSGEKLAGRCGGPVGGRGERRPDVGAAAPGEGGVRRQGRLGSGVRGGRTRQARGGVGGRGSEARARGSADDL